MDALVDLSLGELAGGTNDTPDERCRSEYLCRRALRDD